MTSYFKGVLYTLASAACISVTFIASKQAMLELSPLAFTPLWFGVASLWGLGYYAIQPNKLPWNALKPYFPSLVLLGLTSSAANYFFFASVQLGDPTVVAFFNRAETVFSLLLGAILLKEHLTARQWLGATLAIVGAGIMSYNGGWLVWTVLGMTMVSTLFNSVTSYIAKRNVAAVPPIILGNARTVILAITMALLGGITGQLVMPGFKVFLWILGGAFFGPFFSYLLFYQGLKLMEMGQSAIIRATQPLFVALYSLMLFGKLIAPIQFMGGVIILLGVVLMLSGNINRPISSLSNPLLFYRQRKNSNRQNNSE